MRALQILPGGIYVDATYGGGGHAKRILDLLGPQGRLIAFDRDEDALQNRIEDERLTLIPHNFRYLKRYLRLEGYRRVDGILADLGVSSFQLDTPERGFSYRFQAGLDMRMDRNLERTAADILNRETAAQLQEIFGRYGEVRNARSLARAIVEARRVNDIRTVQRFLEVIGPWVRGDRHRYLSQVFQALRIAVNDEMGALRDFLHDAAEVLRPGGRLVIISYHSLEDRMVKHFMKTGSVTGVPEKDFYGRVIRPLKMLSKKPVLPSAEEIAQNPRARSAKMRFAEKIETTAHSAHGDQRK